MVTILNTSAVLISWDTLGSSDISFYRVTYTHGPTAKDHTSILVPGNATSAVIGGLLEGEKYQFMVSAVVTVNATEMAGEGVSYSIVLVTGMLKGVSMEVW